LLAQKEELCGKLKETRVAQDVAIKAYKKALEDLRVARACEERLRMQMDLLDRRAEDAIAVEEREIEEMETGEVLEPVVEELNGPLLTLQTWGAFEDLPDDFWVAGGFDGNWLAVVGNS
jgi:hypothetical protein